MSMHSSVREPLSRMEIPRALNSSVIAPTPTPKVTRPPDIWSSVAAYFASSTGLWYGSTSTDVPRVTLEVVAARYERVDMGW